MLWSAAAKSAHWSQEGDHVKVTFSNGDATFKFDPAMSEEHMMKFVDSLNTTTDALKTHHGEWVGPGTKYDQKR